jgi:hypothetical protein
MAEIGPNCLKMILSETRLTGAYTVDIDRREHNRGYLARVFCEKEISAHASFLNSCRWLFTTLTQLVRDTALRWLEPTRDTRTAKGHLR